MDIHAFRRINEGEAAARAWAAHVDKCMLRGLVPTTLEPHGWTSGDHTGSADFDYVEVRHAETGELLGRFTRTEFRDLNYDEEGWFDADGPYEPQG